MPDDDLKQHASSPHDFYALLGVTPSTPPADIQRAWRKASIKYHPDKNLEGGRAAVDTFHLLGIARDVLLDADARAAYDAARAARERKRTQDDAMAGERRRMKEKLERREREGRDHNGTAKRKWGESGAGEVDSEAVLRAELARLAEDGKRRRREREERKRREVMEEEATDAAAESSFFDEGLSDMFGVSTSSFQPASAFSSSANPLHPSTPSSAAAADPTTHSATTTTTPEIDRTVKVRWPRVPGPGLTATASSLPPLFARFGPVDSAFLLREKRTRLRTSLSSPLANPPSLADARDRREAKAGPKQTVATGVLVFRTREAAAAAVRAAERGDLRAGFVEEVAWAGKSANGGAHAPGDHPSRPIVVDSPADTPPGTPEPVPARSARSSAFASAFATPPRPGGGAAAGAPPSFGFSPRNVAGPDGAGPGAGATKGSPGFEESVLARLRAAAGRKAEEERIRKEEGEGED